MIGSEVVEQLRGREAVDSSEVPLGRVHEVFVDAYVDVPTWVSIQLVHDGEVLVPLEGAALDAEGLHVAVSRDQIDAVPQTEPDQPLSEARQQMLYDHYGLGVSYSVHDEADVVYEVVEIDPESDLEHPAWR